MLKKFVAAGLACFAVVLNSRATFGYFADSVVRYSSGTGFSANFTNPAVTLGGPTTNVNPFSPAFKNSQLLSLGTNGSLTLHLAVPIVDNPLNPFGIDFIIY